jgi:hypothetical protein
VIPRDAILEQELEKRREAADPLLLGTDELVAARIEIPTASYRVRVRENIFFLQLPAEVSLFDIRAIGVYEDGTTQRLG